jgi:hypothetical protein
VLGKRSRSIRKRAQRNARRTSELPASIPARVRVAAAGTDWAATVPDAAHLLRLQDLAGNNAVASMLAVARQPVLVEAAKPAALTSKEVEVGLLHLPDGVFNVWQGSLIPSGEKKAVGKVAATLEGSGDDTKIAELAYEYKTKAGEARSGNLLTEATDGSSLKLKGTSWAVAGGKWIRGAALRGKSVPAAVIKVIREGKVVTYRVVEGKLFAEGSKKSSGDLTVVVEGSGDEPKIAAIRWHYIEDGKPKSEDLMVPAEEGSTLTVTLPAGKKRTRKLLKHTGKWVEGSAAAGAQVPSGRLVIGGTSYEVLNGSLLGPGATPKAKKVTLGTVSAIVLLGGDSPAPGQETSLVVKVVPVESAAAKAAGLTGPMDLTTSADDGSTLRVLGELWVFAEKHWAKAGTPVKKGYAKYGGGQLDAKLRQMIKNKTLRFKDPATGHERTELTEGEITVLQGMANVEVGGYVAGVNTWDNMIVSMGFKQVTLGWGSLIEIIRMAPEGFKKHGIELDESRTYKLDATVPAIKGVANAQDLRGALWAMRFFEAGLEDDVVNAQLTYSLKALKEFEDTSKKKYGGKWNKHIEDLTAKAWLFEMKNNRESWVWPAISATLDRAAKEGGDKITRDKFLDILAEEMENTYGDKERESAIEKAQATLIAKHKKEKKDPPTEEELGGAISEDRLKKLEDASRQKAKNITTRIPR